MSSARRKVVCLILAIAMVLGITIPCFGAESEKRVVRVGFYESPNFQEVDEDGKLSGYSYDYLQALSQYADWEYEYVTGYTSQECLQLLADGEIDLMGVVQKSGSTQELYDYPTISSGRNRSLLVCRSDDTHYAYEDFEAFDGMTVGIQALFSRNEGLLDYADENGFDINTITYDNREKTVEALNNGDVDAILISLMQNSPEYRVVAEFEPSESYYITTKGNTELLSELNLALQQLDECAPHLQNNLEEKYFDFSEGQTPAFSKAELAYIENNPVIDVMYDANWGPYEFTDEDGKPRGIGIDFAERVSELCGIDFNYIPTDWNENIPDQIKKDDIDMITGLGFNYVRANEFNVDLTQPYLSNEIVTTFVDEEKDNPVYALPKGYQITEYVEAKLPSDANIIYYDNARECLNAICKGKADYTFLSSYEMEYYWDEPKYHSVDFRTLQDTSLEVSFAISREQDKELYTIIEKALKAIPTSERNEIISRYITLDTNDSLLTLLYGNPLQFTILTIIVLAAIVIAIWLVILYRNKNKTSNEMQVATEAKQHFFSQLSHDIRTPMNGILSTVNLVKGSNDVTKYEDAIGDIEKSGQFLMSLINDVLDISKISDDSFELELEPYSFDEFSDSISAILAPRALQGGIDFKITKKIETNRMVLVDKMRIQQIFLNLLMNSIKFTPVGGKVSLTIDSEDNPNNYINIIAKVEDNGDGMSEDFVKNYLFTEFSQEHRERRTDVGTGLGLSIVKKLVDKMNGSITCESKLDEGTTFIVELPAEIASEEMIAKANKKKEIREFNLDGKRILLCEDHPLNTKVARKLLQREDIKVETVVNGEIGLNKFIKSKEGYFDAILMDLNMPVMNGFTATEEIRKSEHPQAKLIPIIAISANTLQEDIDKSKEVGMTAHLSKPIEPDKLFKTLSNTISGETKY